MMLHRWDISLSSKFGLPVIDRFQSLHSKCCKDSITHPLDRFVTSDPPISRSQVHGCPPVVTSLVDIDLVIFVKMLQHFLVTIHGRAVERGIILSSIQIIDNLKGVILLLLWFFIIAVIGTKQDIYNLPCHRVILPAISWTFSCLFVVPWFSVF